MKGKVLELWVDTGRSMLKFGSRWRRERDKSHFGALRSTALCCDIMVTCGSNVFSVQLRQAQLFFSGSKLVHAWCFETILITNCYIFGSNEGIICVLCTLKINHKHFVSMEMAPPIVNKAVINALRL